MELKKDIGSGIIEISIEVNDCVDELFIEAKFSKEMNAFIRVYNPSNVFIGEIFYGYHNFINKIYYSEVKTTMNGLAHSLKNGVYHFIVVMLEPYKITEELSISLTVETSLSKSFKEKLIKELSESVFQEIPWFHKQGELLNFNEIINKEKRYYKGDFHGHTVYSDGAQSGEEARNVLNQQGLDFMALTDHNCIPFGFNKMDILMVPSFEFTLPSGHINIHRINEPDLFGDCIHQIKDTSELMNKVVEKHHPYSNISINHMFLDQWSFTEKNFDIRKINTIEIICDPTYPSSQEANDKAVAFLDFLWNIGWNIYGIGGSDSHNKINDFYEGAKQPSIYGDPSTYVFCNGLSVDNVIEGIKKGNAYVTRYEELDVIINNGQILPGEEVRTTDNIEYYVEIKNFGSQYVHEEYIGKFILNGEVIKTVNMNNENKRANLVKNTSLLKDIDYWWLRFGLYDIKGHVIGFINPIYKGRRNSDIYKLDRLIKEFNFIND
ncbi:CehA/McbA family metallohydrolase [Clostridium sp. DL1XJH146]